VILPFAGLERSIAIAAGTLGPGDAGELDARPDPQRVMTMVLRLLREGDARHGAVGSDLTPADARCLLRAWLGSLEIVHGEERELIS
jgi:hypothetical protein